jgi:hypothetical protein
MSVEDQKILEEEIIKYILILPPPHHPVIMPECADFFLSQINDDPNDKYGIPALFREYFARGHHRFYCGLTNTPEEVKNVFNNMCEELGDNNIESLCKNVTPDVNRDRLDLVNCCIPCSCLTLWGDRRIKQHAGPLPSPNRINKLYIGDVIWLFYFERMGIFKIIGGILDDYANNGKFPIPSDNLTSLILEMMVRDVKKGTSSTIKDRAYTYARCLGWKLTTQPTELDQNKILVNDGFTKLFHKFITTSLYYFKEKRLAEAIKDVQLASPSAATKIAIQDTISLLKNSFESFHHGRNYYNVLNGIIWVIGGIDLIYKLRDTFGIPLSYTRLDQIIPAAYNVLVEKKSINTSEANRYKLHYECAHDARDILIDIAEDVIDFNDPFKLGVWLNLIEPRVEGYRIAYLELTGIDLAKEGNLNIEQQI